MERIASTNQTAYVDRPAAGRYVYRIGVVSDYKDTPDSLDLMLLSKPLAYQAR